MNKTVKEIQALLKQEEVSFDDLVAIEQDGRTSVHKLYETYIRRKQKEVKEIDRLRKMFAYEEALYDQGCYLVAGVDEVGRGPIAGPVTVAAVILPPHWIGEGLNDSKKLTPAKREALYDRIMAEAVAVSCVSLNQDEIDKRNIYQAAREGMYRAIAGLEPKAAYVLSDAMPLPQLTVPWQSIVKGDAKSASIAAASIIAKVTRDRMMEEYDRRYPGYGFANHKGYYTAEHKEGIEKLGPCPIHRRSFEPIRSIVEGK